MATAPEVEVVTTPNVAGGPGGGHGLIVAGIAALALIMLSRSGVLAQVVPGVSIHGVITAIAYHGTPVGACGAVTAQVDLFNETDHTNTYTLFGDVIPHGQPTTDVVGHFWSSLSGIGTHTPYRGISVTIPAFHSATVTVQAGPFAKPGTYDVQWRLQVSGQTITTRQDMARISTSFSTAQTKCQMV